MSPHQTGDTIFIQSLFREYYEKEYRSPYMPPMLEKREFGYMTFTQRAMVRHLSFKSFEQLRDALRTAAPAHVYRSAAVYDYPEAPMEEKGWLGAELIFDIDADHLQTSCKEEHDFRLCVSCRSRVSSNTCDKCGSQQVSDIKWVCDRCLQSAKMEMLKLLEFIQSDFGVREDRLVISFSGNRGYHLAIYDDRVLGLSRDARQEIVEYVTGSAFDPILTGMGLEKDVYNGASDYTGSGWRGRIARESYSLISRLSNDTALAEALSKRLGPKMVDKLRSLEPFWHERPRWDLIPASGAKKHAVISALLEAALDISRAHVDTVVTTDVHRLLRLADTLNGKTGLKASTVDLNLLEDFDPLKECAVLPDKPITIVRVGYAPKFRLGDEYYGPFQDEEVALPAKVSAYLICRGVATLQKSRQKGG